MSRGIYDNWERLVGATLKRQQYYELCHAESRSPSISSISSDFSFDDHSLISSIMMAEQPSPNSSTSQPSAYKPLLRIRDVMADGRSLAQSHSTCIVGVKDTRRRNHHLLKNPIPNLKGFNIYRLKVFLFSLKARKSSQSSTNQKKDLSHSAQDITPSLDVRDADLLNKVEPPPKAAGLNGEGGGSSFNSSSPSPWRMQHREWNVRRPRGRSWVEEGNASAGPQLNEEKVLSNDGDFFSENKDSVLNLPIPQSGDLGYIFNILRESHSFRDYLDFNLIEKQHYQGTPKASRMQRKLIFDTIKEILHGNTEFLLWKLTFFRSMTNYDITKPSYDKVCCEFLRIRDRESSDDFPIIDCVIKKDLDEVQITGWRDCPVVEMWEVILKVEQIIFTDLISETIGDFKSRSSLLSRRFRWWNGSYLLIY